MDHSIDTPAAVVAALKELLPPVFPGPKLDELSGGALCWRTISNLKSLGEYPPECFARFGTKRVLVLRDVFLRHYAKRLRPMQSEDNRRLVREAREATRTRRRLAAADRAAGAQS